MNTEIEPEDKNFRFRFFADKEGSSQEKNLRKENKNNFD